MRIEVHCLKILRIYRPTHEELIRGKWSSISNMPIEVKIGVIFNVRYIFTQKDEYNRRIVNLHMSFGAIVQNFTSYFSRLYFYRWGIVPLHFGLKFNNRLIFKGVQTKSFLYFRSHFQIWSHFYFWRYGRLWVLVGVLPSFCQNCININFAKTWFYVLCAQKSPKLKY